MVPEKRKRLIKVLFGSKRKTRVIIGRNEQSGIFPMEIYFLLKLFWQLSDDDDINFGLKLTVSKAVLVKGRL